MDFTPSQLDAVDIRRSGVDTCVVAGPGSGKTTVLVEYFRRLVESGIDPLRILAITFTEKAASKMREKLAKAFAGDLAVRGRLERAYVSTVHGFCARLLRENAIFAGIDPEFHVMDEQESARQQWTAVTGALDELLDAEPAATLALMRGLASPDIAGAVLGIYDAMRGAGVGIETLAAYPAPPGPGMDEVRALVSRIRMEHPVGWSEKQRAHLEEVLECCERICGGEPLAALACNLTKLKRGNGTYEGLRELRSLLPEAQRGLLTEHYSAERLLLVRLLARFDALYRDSKQRTGALDYADLEEFAVRLLDRNPDVRVRIQGQFDQVLMDEFQDTNGQQAQLLELVRPPDRFYAVGDINQSIYGFRHAEPAVFRQYRDQVGATGRRLVDLRDNFRSRADILHAVETVLDGVPGIEPRALVALQEFSDKEVPSVEALIATGDDAQAIEPALVARRIVELQASLRVKKRAAAFRDFAVLVRNSEVLAGFTSAFDAAGIPWVVNRGKGFYETREVVDLLNLLRVLANPRDEIALAAVLRSPFVELSDEALLRLKQQGSLATALRRQEPAGFDPEDWVKLRRFDEQLAGWRAGIGYLAFDRLLLRAIEETGYPWDATPRGAGNMEKLLAQAREASTRRTLAEFVEDLRLVRASNPREPEAPPEDSADAVMLMTVHSAKGLEFPVVFVSALHKGSDQSLGGLSFSPRYGLGARWRNPVNGESHDDSFQHAIRAERHERESQESNRLLYVAMTRAEEHLVLSMAGPKNWGKMLSETLALDCGMERDEVITRNTPAGDPWRLRVLCASTAPERAPRPQLAEAAAAVTFLPRPAITDQHDGNATVTSVNAYAGCPRRYYLSSYLGLETPVKGTGNGEALSSADFGRQVHALLAGEPVPDPVPEALDLAGRFAPSALGKIAAAAMRVEREFDFLLALDDLVLRGQIDLWFEDHAGLALVDYKTDRVSADEVPGRAAGYAVQLRLYAVALQRLTGRLPNRAWIYFLRPDVAVPIEITPAALAEVQAVVAEFRESQATLSFPPREGPHCRACPHQGESCVLETGPPPAPPGC
ncbi:MAG TPA: UvrD-helicase domain-containing protein [Bryobacteraceae bacterium]|nr:UvrD-helicase domain-containing protein [Bryobacteraceae bacterium]